MNAVQTDNDRHDPGRPPKPTTNAPHTWVFHPRDKIVDRLCAGYEDRFGKLRNDVAKIIAGRLQNQDLYDEAIPIHGTPPNPMWMGMKARCSRVSLSSVVERPAHLTQKSNGHGRL